MSRTRWWNRSVIRRRSSGRFASPHTIKRRNDSGEFPNGTITRNGQYMVRQQIRQSIRRRSGERRKARSGVGGINGKGWNLGEGETRCQGEGCGGLCGGQRGSGERWSGGGRIGVVVHVLLAFLVANAESAWEARSIGCWDRAIDPRRPTNPKRKRRSQKHKNRIPLLN